MLTNKDQFRYLQYLALLLCSNAPNPAKNFAGFGQICHKWLNARPAGAEIRCIHYNYNYPRKLHTVSY